jgi:hypothetical protein
MHGERMALSHSVWADLDALVLEEVNALGAVPAGRPEPPAFASEDDFISKATAYLRQHDDPLRLIDDLAHDLSLSMSENLEMPDEPTPETPEAPEAPLPPQTGVAEAIPEPRPEP